MRPLTSLLIVALLTYAQPLLHSAEAEGRILPANWSIRATTEHPNLIFSRAEAPAIKARLLAEFGAVKAFGDRDIEVFFSDDEIGKRAATTAFIAYWKDYAKRWREDNLSDHPLQGIRMDGVALRGVRRTLLIYDVVASYGYLTAEQTREYRDTLVRSLEYPLGRDSAHPKITPGEKFRAMNIWTDVVTAAGLTALAFPEIPQARDWINLAVNEIDFQLSHYVWDGCWHESPRYHTAMIKIVGVFYEALERRTGIDLFQHPEFKAMLRWLIRFQTPLDLAAGSTLGHPEGVALLPGIGDSSWVRDPFGAAACFARHYTQTDPALAASIMWSWQRAGRPHSGDGIEWGKVLIDPLLAGKPEALGSDISAGKGYIVMRSGFATPQELWFLLRCGNATRSTSHDNADWNAFNLYAFGSPLALDSASGAYSDPLHKAWHDKAVAHNGVVFGDRSQERLDGKIIRWVTTPDYDYSVSDASIPAGVDQYTRHVLFVKPSYFVIWDEIKSDEPTTWMLHTPATQFSWSEHRVRCTTPWDAALDVHVIWPQTPLKPGTKKGKYSDWKQSTNQPQRDHHPFQYQDYFGIPNARGKNFLVVLHPVKPNTSPLEIRDLGDAKSPSLEISQSGRVDRIQLTATGGSLQIGSNPALKL